MRILHVKEPELNKITILEDLKKGRITQKQAGASLRISVRHVRRKLKRYREEGAKSIIHKSRNRPSNRKTDPVLKDRALKIIEEKYYDFGPTFAAEKLAECDNINLHPQTIRRFMMEARLWEKKRKHKKHRSWRKPKESRGEMVQFDGSPHLWFEGDNNYYTLLRFTDDASSSMLWGEFADSESTRSVMQATKNYIKHQGRPISLYTDRGKVFKVNLNNKENKFITQYQRVLEKLDIELIHAYSPQAKGRVERSFQTDQDRLVKELRLAGIATVEEANTFIKDYYMPKHNRKFARSSARSGDLHRPIENYNLDDVFCTEVKRVVRNDWTIQHNKRIFQLKKKQLAVVRPRDTVIVCQKLDSSIIIKLRSFSLNFTELIVRSNTPESVAMKSRKIRRIQPKDYLWEEFDSSLLKLKSGHF